MGQMATQMNQAQSQNSDKFPSQTMQNPKNVSAITLRSGNQIQVPPPVEAPASEPVKLHSTPEKEDEIVAQKRKLPNKKFHAGGPSSSNYDLPQPPIPLPFPPRELPNKKMEEAEKELEVEQGILWIEFLVDALSLALFCLLRRVT